jgi:two-component SAPR family response regulator
MSTDIKFILVDDDAFTNMVHNIIIKDALGEEVVVETFTDPAEGLEFIEKEYAGNSGHTILFIDINMPQINGWEFLEQYENFSEQVKMQINIYILSSSLDWRDKDKAAANKTVKGFISKPLDFETIKEIAGRAFQDSNFAS